MKIIHCADIHLGSKMNSKLTSEKAKERKIEVLDTFQRMVRYAIDNDIKIILLSGDVFDSDQPYKKDKDMFYKIIERNPNIDFFYLKGNHDCEATVYDESYNNLKQFNDNWQTYYYDNIAISGLEINNNNYLTISNTLNLQQNNINIVMLHGQVTNNDGVNQINIKKLKDKNIDYLALGHIHSYASIPLDSRGIYVYSGCLEGRGFDEIGEKGFVVLEVVNDKVEHKFISFSKRIIHEVEIDITGKNSLYDIIEFVNDNVKMINFNDLLRINLIGEVEYFIEDIEDSILKALESKFYYVEIKNKLIIKIDMSKYKDDLSIKGEFYREVINDPNYSEEEKKNILNIGFRVLEGREID